MPASATALRGVHRRLAFPPPPVRPSLTVWPELGDLDDELAGALFFLCRRIRDLADSPPNGLSRWRRTEDVRAAAASAPEIAADLLLLGARDFALSEGIRSRAAAACHRLSVWAGERGYGEMCIQFAETAAALQPSSPRATYEAARANRCFARPVDAEILYSRAICLARSGRNWRVYVRGHLGLASISRDRGHLDRAAAHYATAARRARDTGEKWLAALVEHDLFVLRTTQGDYDSAHAHAERAYLWMPAHNEAVPALVHDYAYLLLRADAPRLAIRLLDALVGKRLPSTYMVLYWSTHARVAGVLGETARFHDARKKVATIERKPVAHSAAAEMNLAYGAYALGLSAIAEQHALRAADLARSNTDRQVMADAESLIGTLRGGVPAGTRNAEPPPSHLQRLADALAERLARWRGPTWKRKRQADRTRLGVV
jgi:tetratricopeptide (TPR) repeat protein